MAATASLTELRKMQIADLQKDITAQKVQVAKLRLGVTMQKEKDHARYKREKRQLAKMLTVLTEKKQAESLKQKEAQSTVSAQENSSSTKN